MAKNSSISSAGGLDPFEKLNSPASSLLREAESQSEFRNAQDAAKERRMAHLMMDQSMMPMTVNEIRVHGATNTRRGFLDPLLHPIIGSTEGAPCTVGDTMARLQIVNAKLSGLQIFQPNPEIFLTSSQQVDPSTTPTDVDVDIKVRELPRFKLQTGTDVGNGEGSAYGSLLWRNILGGAEMLSLNAKTGTRTRSAYSAELSAPVMSDPDMSISLEGIASAAEKPWASHEEVAKGGALKFSWFNSSRDKYSVEYNSMWRQVTGLGQNASPTIRGDAGDTVKSAIKSTYQRERRDNPQLPQSGYMIRSAWELAGVGPLGGSVGYSKSDYEVGGAFPISLPGVEGPTGISIGGGLRMGMLWPVPMGFDFGGKAQPSRVNDRFQLGGPTDVRGFKLGGLGPHDGTDAVGGDAFAAGSVNMLFPLPYKGPESGLRFQLFANGGRLVALKTKPGDGESGLDARTVTRGMLSTLGELFNGTPSTAAGFGLVYAHPVARFELNFSLPLVLRKGEVGTKGLQLGVGINFL